MKFTFNVCLLETPNSVLQPFPAHSRAQLWQRKAIRARAMNHGSRTIVRQVAMSSTRLKPIALHPSQSYQSILTLSTKAPSLLPIKLPSVPVFNDKTQWVAAAWRLYRCHFVKISFLSMPHILNLATYRTFRVTNFVRKSMCKRLTAHKITTFQTHNL